MRVRVHMCVRAFNERRSANQNLVNGMRERDPKGAQCTIWNGRTVSGETIYIYTPIDSSRKLVNVQDVLRKLEITIKHRFCSPVTTSMQMSTTSSPLA